MMSGDDRDTTSPSAPGSRSALEGWLRALELTSRIDDEPSRTLPAVINAQSKIHGDAPALLADRECFSFRKLAERSNQYSRWALAQNLGVDDTVCLFMPNRPEYLAIWLGITQVGGVVALLNVNLVGASLAHCITIAGPKHIIVAAELLDAFDTAAEHLAVRPRLWAHGENAVHTADMPTFSRIDLELGTYGGDTLSAAEQRPVSIADRALCIYTSGTTGLPKAANVSHRRVMMWSFWFAGMMGTQANDRMYNCLPMYHSIGGVVALGSVLVNGGSVFVAEKFSAQQFWDDVVRWDCSLFQYIGELCRYLLNSKVAPRDKQHRLRLCCGNGLRLDVWNTFKERFRIPQILEFYAATEGNFSLYNLEGKPGAIGRIPSFLAHRFPAAIVRFDAEKAEPVRDARGLCVRCARNEVGEAIGKISDEGSNGANRFEGYTSRAESEKKILRNVFVEGDAWYRTGDLMRLDEKGFFYFVDRIGDTFRWKGENVATFEVSEALTSCPGVVEASVYGVAVPGTEGRAGMAALVIDPSFDLVALRAHLVARLADYARPLFLRISGKLEVTETFKQKKRNLVREGFDPGTIAEALYFDHPDLRAYVALNEGLYRRLWAGEFRI